MKYLTILLLSCVAVAQTGSFGSKQHADKRILFLGNSYTYYNKMPRILARLALSAEPSLDIYVAWETPGGFTLEGHNGSNITRKLLKDGPWDLVVLQEQSMRPLMAPREMKGSARELTTRIRKEDSKPVFFMTWARANNPAMFAGLDKTYSGLSKELSAGLAPVGRAWEASLKERPELELYDPDGSHPSALGSYLTACVFYVVLLEGDPRGLGHGGLTRADPDDLAYLRELAWRTTKGVR